jgi:hypothetical protein
MPRPTNNGNSTVNAKDTKRSTSPQFAILPQEKHNHVHGKHHGQKHCLSKSQQSSANNRSKQHATTGQWLPTQEGQLQFSLTQVSSQQRR